MAKEFTVIIEKDEEGYFIAEVPELKGCHTQAKSLDTLMERIKEAIQLCLDVEKRGILKHILSAFKNCRMTSFPADRERNHHFIKPGFIVERQRGSHVFLRHPDGRTSVVSVHSGETIGGLLLKILRDVEMTRADLLKLL